MEHIARLAKKLKARGYYSVPGSKQYPATTHALPSSLEHKTTYAGSCDVRLKTHVLHSNHSIQQSNMTNASKPF
jgi:hypothetical protein